MKTGRYSQNQPKLKKSQNIAVNARKMPELATDSFIQSQVDGGYYSQERGDLIKKVRSAADFQAYCDRTGVNGLGLEHL